MAPEHADEPPPLIGVSARIYTPGSAGVELPGVWTKTLHYLEQSVAHWLLSGHAMPVMVPAVTRDSIVRRSDIDLKHYAEALDGLVLQGGNDVAPEHYRERPLQPEWAGDSVRDRYEMALVDAFVAAGKPVFGICRGLQLLNVHYGGTLLQDIATQRPESRQHRDGSRYEQHFHAVELVPGSRLAQLYPGRRRAVVNSIHHQAIKDVAPGFAVEATCPDDGTIEAIRRSGAQGGWVAGVQWHPEFHAPGGDDAELFDDRAILDDFLAAARAARTAHAR